MRLVHAELLKLTTVRTPGGLLAGVVLLTGVSVAGVVAAGALAEEDAVERLAQAAAAASTFAVIMGLYAVTTEFRHGTIAQTFLVTPVRERVVAAKLAAGTLAGLLYGLVAAGVALAVGLPWLAARGEELGLGTGAVVELVRLVGAFALWAALGAGIGAAVRNQVGAIVGTFAWFLIAEPLLTFLGVVLSDGGEIGPVGPYLPGTAFDALVGGDVGGERAGLLSPLAGLGLALAYLALVVAVGAAAMVRRDPK